MSATNNQVGGTHYQVPYPHWHLMAKLGLGYFEGCTTKYVVRWRDKNGLQDLQKALSYLNELQSLGIAPIRSASFGEVAVEVSRFNRLNNVGSLEGAYIAAICTWQQHSDLDEARSLLLQLFDETEPERVLRDPIPVPLTEENHHAEREQK